MRKLTKLILYIIVCFFSNALLRAQTPSDAVMMKQRESCFVLLYDHGYWNKYWEGTYLRSNGTVSTVKRNIIQPMIAIGIMDKINLIIGAPYVETKSSEPNGGKFAGAKGFQDLSLALKSEVFNKQLGKGKFSFHTTVGFSTPMTNYLSDYRPYSIGFGAKEWSLRGIAQYSFNNGVYVRTALAHLWRGQTRAERDYYYNNGSYYTSWMDVPNAWDINGIVGIWLLDHALKLEASYVGLKSTSGDDIRKYNAGQPTNKVNVDQVGFATQYYFKNVKGLGVLAYYSQVINGRNMGKFSDLGLGVSYQFKI